MIFFFLVTKRFVMSSKTERNFSVSLNILISKMNKKYFYFSKIGVFFWQLHRQCDSSEIMLPV